MPQCNVCEAEFETERGLATHAGMKHKNVSIHLAPDDEQLLKELVAANKEEEFEGGMAYFDRGRAARTARDIRATLSGMYDMTDNAIQQAAAVEFGFHMETIRATARSEAERQMSTFSRSVDSRILAAQKLAEDTQAEGDVFAAVVSPIELGMDGRVWVTGSDSGAVKEINTFLSVWNVMDTITAAWQDMETYSAFYVIHRWKNGVPTPVHLSPKRVCVGPDTGFGPYAFSFLGDELQSKIDFGEAATGKGWNEWMQGMVGKPINPDTFSWVHFLKPKHKMYPYPWLAKAATPAYTRQIIEEMRLALVQGVINQLWVMTIDQPLPGEVSKLKAIISANRAERVGFLLWRSGLEVKSFSPESIENLLLPEAWWTATLDIFRRIGRTIRIISGEPAQRSGQGSGDAEVDVRIAQNKAMAHRSVVAKKIVLDLVRQWGEQGKSESVQKLLESGRLEVHTTPIQLFLGEDLKNIWGPMWNNGMASVETIHSAIGLDTDVETERLKAEKEAGFDEVYQARQQFAQRVATPGGDVTKSSEPGRPEGQQTKASIQETQDSILRSFDEIDATEDQEERRRKVLAFIMMLAAMLRAHMRGAYQDGYAAAYGNRTPSSSGIDDAFMWEQDYINGFSEDLLVEVDTGQLVGDSYRYRVIQHVQASWRHAYMSGVFQAKVEDGWGYWQRVLRPGASKSGPCSTCREDSKVWHRLSEPFWDHPHGVCSAQIVRFMRTSTEGWESLDRQPVAVPLMEWEEK